MPKKGSAKCSALKGAVQGTLSHRGSADHSPRGKNAKHSAPEGQRPKKGQCRTQCPRRAVHKYPRGTVQNRVPQRGSAPKMAVQSTLPKKGSADFSVPKGQCRAQCPRRAELSTAPEGQCRIQPRGSAENSPRGAVQGKEREKSGSVEQRVNTDGRTVYGCITNCYRVKLVMRNIGNICSERANASRKTEFY